MPHHSESQKSVWAHAVKHNTGSPTKAQKERFRLMYEIGCVCCRIEGMGKIECQINHHLKGGMGSARIGHDATTGECPWHHVGEPPAGMNERQARAHFGPSRKLHGREFRSVYGNDYMLLEYQNAMIAAALPAKAA